MLGRGGGQAWRGLAWTLCCQVLFVVVDVAADNGHVLQYFGLKADEAPTLRLINMETNKKHAPAAREPITAASVTTFCEAVLHGQVQVPRETAQRQGLGALRTLSESLPGSPALPPEPGGPPRLGPAASEDPRGQEL